MTPHEHYKAAESLLEYSDQFNHTSDVYLMLLGKAQVHATLASVVSWPTEER